MRCVGLNPDGREMWQYSETNPSGVTTYFEEFFFREEKDGLGTWTSGNNKAVVENRITHMGLEKDREEFLVHNLTFETICK